MKIIRSPEGDPLGAVWLLPLLLEWGINGCNVDGCTDKPTAILADMGEGVPSLGVCEKHYQEAKAAGKWSHRFVWGVA